MTDVRLNPVTGDLDVTDYVAPRMFRTEELINARAQRVRINIRTFLGEWFADVNRGVPWLQQMIGSKDDAFVVAILRDAIARVPGIDVVTAITSVFDRSIRLLTIRFTATTDVGVLDDEFTITI